MEVWLEGGDSTTRQSLRFAGAQRLGARAARLGRTPLAVAAPFLADCGPGRLGREDAVAGFGGRGPAAERGGQEATGPWVALVGRGGVAFEEKAAAVAGAGAAAMVVVNTDADGPNVLCTIVAGEHNGQCNALPIALIGATDGGRLLDHLRTGGRASLAFAYVHAWFDDSDSESSSDEPLLPTSQSLTGTRCHNGCRNTRYDNHCDILARYRRGGAGRPASADGGTAGNGGLGREEQPAERDDHDDTRC
jgi:hypothetical protein